MPMWKSILTAFIFILLSSNIIHAQTPVDEGFFDETQTATDEADATMSGEMEETEPTPFPTARPDITQTNEETREPLLELIQDQNLRGLSPFNAIRYSIRSSVEAGVPPNTIVLLLLLPLVVAVIAAARHIVGIRGFGIFLPAALAIVFLAIGPIIGIGLFVVMVVVSTYLRILMRKFKIKMQYLPRMSLMLWFVVISVLGILFLAPLIKHSDFTNISIFPVLILVLLSEDFSKVQLGKSIRTAVDLASETIVMALISYIFLTMQFLREFALLNPEMLLIGVFIFNIIIGQYVGLRFVEYWKYRKLISS